MKKKKMKKDIRELQSAIDILWGRLNIIEARARPLDEAVPEQTDEFFQVGKEYRISHREVDGWWEGRISKVLTHGVVGVGRKERITNESRPEDEIAYEGYESYMPYANMVWAIGLWSG